MSFEMQEFYDAKIPEYAILSHRWQDGEITLKDYQKGRNKDSAGYAKVMAFCAKAAADGFSWGWVDTCCIDKKSSAELSEAINSMFRWYQKCSLCYVYLCDVQLNEDKTVAGFETSVWFTRGWTLQELLAPKAVEFCDQDWKTFGTREKLSRSISKITGIHRGYIRSSYSGGGSVAERMSWASKRETSRIEDQAYCLLGIFNINMPLLYGEGEKAFLRLQEEIIRSSDDMSVFAWGSTYDVWQWTVTLTRGILAPAPAHFSSSGEVEAWLDSTESVKAQKLYKAFQNSQHLVTNKGLQIDALCAINIENMLPSTSEREWHLYETVGDPEYLILNCVRYININDNLERFFCAVKIARQASSGVIWRRYNNELYFVKAADLIEVIDIENPKRIFIQLQSKV